MSKRTQDAGKLYPVGDFWLVPPDAKYKDYGIKWYDSAARQTRRLGTGTTDLDEAKFKIKEHALRHGDGQHKDELVLQSLERYYEAYGRNLPSAEAIEQAIGFVAEHWSDVMVTAVDATAQKALVFKLRRHGLADSTISCHIARIFTAIRYAVQFKNLPAAIMPTRLHRRFWGVRMEPVTRKSSKPSKRQLSPEEWGRIFDAAVEADYEHGLRYMITAIGTHARPAALRQLTGKQIDLEREIVDLNPPGREQNKKRRPIVPMAPTLQKWMAHWATQPGAHVITQNGLPLANVDSIAWLIERSKVPNCTPYTFRHSVASWLAAEGIEKWERKCFLGHSVIDGGATDDYTHYDPRYLRNAAAAIERLFEAIAQHTAFNLLRVALGDQGAPSGLWDTVPAAFLGHHDGTKLLPEPPYRVPPRHVAWIPEQWTDTDL